jgi:D-alanyl-D-alanine carboxypeptidase
VRVSGEVKASPRPKARTEGTAIPEEMVIAMAEGIDGALAEATAEPAPEGTLQFQAEAMAEGDMSEDSMAVAEAGQEAAPDAAVAVAANDPAPAAPAEPGTLEAQAAALTAAPPETMIADAGRWLPRGQGRAPKCWSPRRKSPKSQPRQRLPLPWHRKRSSSQRQRRNSS